MLPQPNEKDQLRGFICEVAEFMSDLAGDSGREFASELTQAVCSSNRLDGLRAAASDMIEWTCDLTPEEVARLDLQLESARLPTLSQMRDRRYRQIQRILDGKALRSEIDYRLLNDVLSDTESSVLSEAERQLANMLLASYHQKRDA